MDAIMTGGNQRRLLWWTMLENSDGTVLKIKEYIEMVEVTK